MEIKTFFFPFLFTKELCRSERLLCPWSFPIFCLLSFHDILQHPLYHVPLPVVLRDHVIQCQFCHVETSACSVPFLLPFQAMEDSVLYRVWHSSVWTVIHLIFLLLLLKELWLVKAGDKGHGLFRGTSSRKFYSISHGWFLKMFLPFCVLLTIFV